MTIYKNRTGLMFAVPLSGNALVPEWAMAFHQLHPPMDYNVDYAMIKGRPVDEARNTMAESAVAKNCKFLFFVDEDVTPPAHALRQLIYHMEQWDRVAVAAGIYCHKSPPNMPMVFRGNGAGPYWDWKVGEVFDCSGVGMGCALIRVDALRTIQKPWFKTVDSIDQFMENIPQGEMWTEDLYFCDKITKATGPGVPEGGWQIVADGGILPNHWDAKTGQSFNLPPTAKPLRPVGWKEGTKKIVDLGCGGVDDSYHTEEGKVLRVDIREDVKPDYRCDVRRLPFATKEFDIVFSSHVLEHFARNETKAVLDEWVRILKDEGEFRMVLPNLEWAAKHIQNKEIDSDVLNVLYGAQSYQENFHKCGFTPQIIEQLLAERGFKKFVWDFHNYHMFVRAWKIPPPESIQPGEVQPIIRIERTGIDREKAHIEDDGKTVVITGDIECKPGGSDDTLLVQALLDQAAENVNAGD